jgi:6-phosphogluconolactonase (cycloisomerase 2 family)
VDAGRSLPTRVIVHPSGKFAFVSNDDGVSAFRIDPATGALTLLSMIDPSGAFQTTVAVPVH